MIKLKEEEKIKLADEICKNYFDRNFGTLSKSDFETLIFSKYIEHLQNSGETIKDFKISKELGITQSKARSLRERKELKYPSKNFNWKKEIEKELKNAKYDEKNHSVQIIIEDVNAMNEVRNYIEENGWYNEVTLNKKLLTLPIACYIDIFVNQDEFESAVNINELKKSLKKYENDDDNVIEFLSNLTKDGLKKFLMNASTEIVKAVLSSLIFNSKGTVLEYVLNCILSII